jgi:glycolate oxidase
MSSTQVTAIYIRSFYLNGQLEGDLDRAEALAGRILKMCVAMGGSLTGEHGLGVEKKVYLPDMFSEEEIDCMKRLACRI